MYLDSHIKSNSFGGITSFKLQNRQPLPDVNDVSLSKNYVKILPHDVSIFVLQLQLRLNISK